MEIKTVALIGAGAVGGYFVAGFKVMCGENRGGWADEDCFPENRQPDPL